MRELLIFLMGRAALLLWLPASLTVRITDWLGLLKSQRLCGVFVAIKEILPWEK